MKKLLFATLFLCFGISKSFADGEVLGTISRLESGNGYFYLFFETFDWSSGTLPLKYSAYFSTPAQYCLNISPATFPDATSQKSAITLATAAWSVGSKVRIKYNADAVCNSILQLRSE